MIRLTVDLRNWTVLPALMLLVVSCNSSEQAADAVVVYDSAGVRIVENAEPRLPSGSWMVSSEPVLLIGANETDEMQILFRVAGAAVLRDGRVVVANQAEPMLRWFDSDGRLSSSSGRVGGGPGEFERPVISSLWKMAEDSIGAWEHSARRLQVFDPHGQFARAVVLDPLPDESFPQVVGRSDAGFVAHPSSPSTLGQPGDRTREHLSYVTYEPDGTFRGRLATLPGYETFTMEVRMPLRPEPFLTPGRPPLARFPLSWLHGDRFYYGSADQFEIAVFDLDGTLLELIRKSVPKRPVTRTVRDAYQEQFFSGEGEVQHIRPTLDDLPYPDSMPAYRRMRVDQNGWLWVQSYDVLGDTTVTWSTFDPSGRWVTDLDLPRAWQIHDIGSEYILAVVRDEYDVEQIKKFRLSR